MSYPRVKKEIHEKQLTSLHFKPTGRTEGRLFFTTFYKEKNGIKLDVSTSREVLPGNKHVRTVDQVVTLEINDQWAYVPITDFDELKTLAGILFKE